MFLLSLLAAPVALAGAAEDLAEAKRHSDNGLSFYKEARYREAVEELEQAIALSIKAKPEAAGVVSYNLGQAYEKLGDIPAAVKAYREYLRLVPKATDRDRVQSIIANLEARMARGLQELSVTSEPSGAALAVGGKLRTTTPATLELPYGPHEISISHEGYDTATRTVELTPQTPVKLDVSLAKKAVPVTAPAPAPAPAPVVQKQRFWTWVALGVAAVSFGGAAILGSEAKRNADLLRAQKNQPPVPDLLYDTSLRQQGAANALYVTAGLAGAAGGALFFVEGSF